MKKTLNISIAKRQFSIEEDAYQKLDAYITSIKNHFSGNREKEDILADIEERIAEHFLELNTSIISLKNVEELIGAMGTIEQFEDEASSSQENKKISRRLYRDSDDMVIAGVASGLGHYFNLDPLIFRVIFIASLFMGGLGILIYIILWITVPEAKTASQKLAMHGNPATIETLSEKVQEHIQEIKNSDKGNFYKFISNTFKILGRVIQFLLKIIPKILRIFLGISLVFVGVLVLICVMVASGFLVSGDIMMFPDIPLHVFLPGFFRYIILLGISLSFVLPALFVFLVGISMFKKKNLISAPLGFSLLGVWLLAVAVTGFGAAKIINNYQSTISTSPFYVDTTVSITPESAFNKLDVKNGLDVKLIKSPETSLKITGHKNDVDMVEARVVDGILIISRKYEPQNKFCVFCFANTGSVQVSLAVSNPLDSIEIHGGSSVSGGLPDTKNLSLDINDGSFASLSTKITELALSLSNGSSISLSGSSTSANISLKNGSNFDGEDFKIKNAKIDISGGSDASIFVRNKLEVNAKNESSVYYRGKPILMESTDHGSEVISDN